MNVCKYCENYIAGIKCDNINCDLKKLEKENTVLKKKNKELKKQVEDLKLEKSYMINPNAIGDRHEMGCW